ncbi:cytochrome P450 [Streptomyces nitrosporeus]|uniref:Cytochrome P450 n=1 Tax=Streptomyces nitrosporeus TaxID=28894 RepID=A0A5J6FI31_9ACTN|nr:cytochrome P450 [Streptomyces nitrosporeus]QEU76259.1 cytochrome P450 [Streptomyces nitrosporeus]GGZ21983.1 cytochrome P450 monooxygenase [Streptomyces nitrosporeus]
MPAIPSPRTPAQLFRAGRAFQHSLPEGLEHLRDTYGPVSAFGIGPTRTHFLFGPDANALVMKNEDNFRFSGAYDMLRPIAGNTALVTTDGEPHARRKRKARPSFHRGGAEESTRLILASIDATIDSWRPGQHVDVHGALRSAIRSAMLRQFCGERLAAREDYLATELERIHELMDRPLPQQLIAWKLPSTARRRALDAIAAVERLIYEEIRRRRRERDPGGRGAEGRMPAGDPGVQGQPPADGPGDLISVMLSADGPTMSDQEVRDMVVSALIAGYDPVGSGLGWAVYNSLNTPGVWQRLREEASAAPAPDATSAAEVRELRYTQWVVQESLRTHPPVVMSPRRCVRSFRFQGHLIPGGSLVAVSEYITHRSLAVWREPDRFLPERWDTSREGHRAPTPFEYLPYGYGGRRCIGANIASVVLPAALSRLARRTTLELRTRRPQFGGIPALIPRDGLFVEVGAAPREEKAGSVLTKDPR